jgi:hypothetical protein
VRCSRTRAAFATAPTKDFYGPSAALSGWLPRGDVALIRLQDEEDHHGEDYGEDPGNHDRLAAARLDAGRRGRPGHRNLDLIAGIHPSGDAYGWANDADLADLFKTGKIERIENADINRFIDAFENAVLAVGGVIVTSRGGGALGILRDYSAEAPIMPVSAIFSGLERIPNTAANFPQRVDIVSMLSAVRAALGREAESSAADYRAGSILKTSLSHVIMRNWSR